MDFYALGLDAPLETTALHDPRTCTKQCCRMVPRTVVTPAGTRVRPPSLGCVPLSAMPPTPTTTTATTTLETDEALGPLETITQSISMEAAAVPFYTDPPDSPSTDDIYGDGADDMDESFAAAIASEETNSLTYHAAEEAREKATRLCVLAVHSTGVSQSDCVLQAVVKGFGDGGAPTVCYDSLWRIPHSVKISVKAFKIHGIHYRDLRASGEPPSREILTLMQLLKRLTDYGARLVIHNAKMTIRLLKQTAVQNGYASVWSFPFVHTCMTAPSRRILNMPAKANPKALAVPTERDVYRYLYKTPFDEEEPDATCISELARTCTVTRDNFVAGVARGWWS